MDDKSTKDRVARNPHNGSSNGRTKISEKDIIEMVELFPVMSNKAIADYFGGVISECSVSSIRVGRTWSTVTGFKRVFDRRERKAKKRLDKSESGDIL